MGSRALRAAAGGGIDAEAVVAQARGRGVMGWVRPTGEIHAEGAPLKNIWLYPLRRDFRAVLCQGE